MPIAGVVRCLVTLQAVAVLAACSLGEEAGRTLAFCAEGSDLLRDVAADLAQAPATPDRAGDIVAKAVERLEAVDPPPDVADEWAHLVNSWTSVRDRIRQDGPLDPSESTWAFAEFSVLHGQLAEGDTLVDDWGRANC